MNLLAAMEFTDEDRQQFAQLIGYSVSGYGELPYAADKDGCQCPVHKAEREDHASRTPPTGTATGRP